MDAWTDVMAAAALGPWLAVAPGLALAALRWFGLLLWLPALGAAGVSVRLRMMLALLLAIVSLPAATAFHWNLSDGPSRLACNWLVTGIGELAVGSAIGLGVRILLSALILAGELIDQQAGLAFQQVFNPLSEGETGPTGVVLGCLALPVVLTLGESSGEVAFADAILQLFDTVPIGAAAVDRLTAKILVGVVQQSLLLALQVAAPVLASISLVTMGVGWLGRTTPQLPLGPLVAPLRVGLCLALLAASLPGMAELITHHFDVLSGSPVEQLLSPTALPSTTR
ncbi:MAG: flagellar biosynthetic protein FliR [Planctomycetaceae bacterium]